LPGDVIKKRAKSLRHCKNSLITNPSKDIWRVLSRLQFLEKNSKPPEKLREEDINSAKNVSTVFF